MSCGIALHKFNYRLHKSIAQQKSFPGGTSKELLNCVETTLENLNFDVILLNVGANDLLNYECQDSVEVLLDNLKQIECKCKSAKVTRILISGIAVNNKLTSAYISNIRQHINNMFQDNSFVLINNKNIPTSSVFCNGIHLLDAPTSTLISQKPSEITNSCIANIESEAKCCSESFKKLKQKKITAQLYINSIRAKFL